MYIKNRIANNPASKCSGFGRPDGRAVRARVRSPSWLTAHWLCSLGEGVGRELACLHPRFLTPATGLLLYPAEMASCPPRFTRPFHGIPLSLCHCHCHCIGKPPHQKQIKAFAERHGVNTPTLANFQPPP